MKITKRQLIRLINENLLSESLTAVGIGAYMVAGWLFGKTYKMTVANRSGNDEYAAVAYELGGNISLYEKVFSDLYTHAKKCNDQNLILELSYFIEAGQLLFQLIDIDAFDMSDGLGALADITSSTSSIPVSASAVNLSKSAVRSASPGLKAVLGPIFMFLFSGYDVYDAESVASKVAQKINPNKLRDDMQGFLSIHNQLEKGELPC